MNFNVYVPGDIYTWHNSSFTTSIKRKFDFNKLSIHSTKNKYWKSGTWIIQ